MFPLIAIILLFYFWAHRNSLQYQAILLIILLGLKMSCGKGYISNRQGTLSVTQYGTLRQCNLLSHNPSPAWFHSLTLFNPQAMDTRKLVVMIQFLTPYFLLWHLHKHLAGLTFILYPTQHPTPRDPSSDLCYHLTHLYHPSHMTPSQISHPLSIITNGRPHREPFGTYLSFLLANHIQHTHSYSNLLTYWFVIGW